MKKLLLLFIGLLLSITKVYAFESGVWTDEIINDPNILIKDSEIKYKWYQNVENLSINYYLEGENEAIYPNIARDYSTETNFSEWNDEKPQIMLNRVVESKDVGRYRTLRPIRYLFLENFSGGYLIFKIAELNILINGEKTSTTMACNNCSFGFESEISDEQYRDSAYINNGGSLKIDLGAYYGIEQIRLELYMFDEVSNTKTFDLYFNEGSTLGDRNYAYKEITSYVVSADSSQPEKYLIMADSTFIVNPVFSDWVYTDGMVNATYYRQMQFLRMYQYKDIKYRYYKNEQIYLDGYYKDLPADNHVKDEDSAKMFYLYEYKQQNESQNEDISDPDEEIEPINDDTTPNEIENNQSEKETTVTDNNPNQVTEDNKGDTNNVDESAVIDSSLVNLGTLESDVSVNNTSDVPLVVNEVPPLTTTKDLLADADYYEKQKVKIDNKTEFFKTFNFKLIITCMAMILMILIFFITIRHHNLSHQN